MYLGFDHIGAVGSPDGETYAAAVIPLGNPHLQVVYAGGEGQRASRLAVVAPFGLAGLRVPVDYVERNGVQQLLVGFAVDESRFRCGGKKRYATLGRRVADGRRGFERHGVKHHPAARNRSYGEYVTAGVQRPGRNCHFGTQAARGGLARVEIFLVGSRWRLYLRAEVVEDNFQSRGKGAVYLDEIQLQP